MMYKFLQMSPEIMDSKRYNSKTDIWSLGCILYEMMCLKLPFEGDSMTQLCQNIQTGSGAVICKTLAYSTALKDLCKDMLQKNSVLRPGINAILGRPVVKSRISSFLDASKKRREFSHTVLHGMQILAALPEREQLVEQEKISRVDEIKEMNQKKGPVDKSQVQIEKDRVVRNQETERLRQMIWKAEGQDSPASRLEQQKANKILNGVPQERHAIQDQKAEMQLQEVQQEHQKRGIEDGRKKVEISKDPEMMRREVLIKDFAGRNDLAARQVQERIQALDKEEPNSYRRVGSDIVSRVEVNPEEQNRELIRRGRERALVEKKVRSPTKNVGSSFQCRADQVPTPSKSSHQDAPLNKCPEARAVDRPPSALPPTIEPPEESKREVAVASGEMKAKVRDNLLRFEKERLERQAKAERKIIERARRVRERQVDLQSLSPSCKQPLSPAPKLRLQHQKVSEKVEIATAVKRAPTDEILSLPMLPPPPPPPPKMIAPESSLLTAMQIDQRSEETLAQTPRVKDILAPKANSIDAAAIMTEQTGSRRTSSDTSGRADPEESQIDDHREPAIREGEGNFNANHMPHQENRENKYRPMGQKDVSPFIFSEDTFDRSNIEVGQDASRAVQSSGLDVEFSIEIEEEFAELYAQMQEVVGQSFSENQSDGYSYLDSALEDEDDTFEERNYEDGEDEIGGV